MKLRELVETSKGMAATRSRLEKARLLAELLVEASPAEIPLVTSYLSGSVRQGRVGIGYATLGTLRRVPGAAMPELELDLVDVDRALDELDGITGSGSSRGRSELLRELYARAAPDEQEFLSRLLVGEMRHGSLQGIMVEAVAKASGVPAADVRRALMLSADLGLVASTLMAEGVRGLDRFRIELMRPVQPMLAQTADDVPAALDALGDAVSAVIAVIDVKLDGARIQVHKSGDDVRIFTRRLNDVSHACPEVVATIRGLDVESIILDGEVIALKKDGRPYPFQVTMRRFGRRLDVGAMRTALPLTSFYFDCLYLDGESLIDHPLSERIDKLAGAVPEPLIVKRLITSDPHEAKSFAEAALDAGHEGVMVKALDAPYAAGSRGKAWLKVKTALTLDLVVLAAEWGSGRREGWLSNLHLGARDSDSGEFVMLGKTFKGMTDEILEWQTEELQRLETARDEFTVFVRPERVVEIAFNDLQKSPHYPGGLALRFARLKGYRHDKGPEDADTIEAVRAIYQKQTGERPDDGEKQLSLL